MTTQVTIKATSHDVEVRAQDSDAPEGSPGAEQVLATVKKGTEWTTHTWGNRAIVVKEVPNAG